MPLRRVLGMRTDIDGDEFLDRPELIHKRARVIMMQRFVQGAWFTIVLVVIGLLAWNLHSTNEIQHFAASCTAPQGSCFRQSVARQQEIIRILKEDRHQQDIVTRRIVVAAAACADHPGIDSVPDITRCVDQQLKGFFHEQASKR